MSTLLNQILPHPDEILNSLEDRPNIIYGAAQMAKMLHNFLTHSDVSVESFVVEKDFHNASYDDLPKNIQILSIDELINQYKSINLFIGFYLNDKQRTIHEKVLSLKQKGMDVNVYVFDVHLLMYPERKFSYDWVVTQSDKFQHVYDRLDDALSKETLIRFINQRMSGILGELDNVCQSHQYFDDTIIHLDKNEEFIDCGAYDGDTIRDFFKALQRQIEERKYRHIYALEPNKPIFQTLYEKFKNENNISFLNKGAWSKNEILRFSGDKLRSSRLDVNGSDTIEVDALDELLPEAEPTLIKFDIEGAEQEALRGAKRLITEFHPKLAVCIYHKNDDLLVIPSYLETLFPDYKMFLRAHESKSGEVVLYCVP